MVDIATNKFETYLKSIEKFDRDAFEYSKQFFNVLELQKGDFFVETGKICRNFGFIVSGYMRAYYVLNGNEITTCLCSENLFASSTVSFILQQPSAINIVALEKTVVLTISFADLNNLYNKFDFWARAGRIFMEKEFIDIECYNRCQQKLSPDERYLNLVKENPDILNRVPLYVIASYLGITPETLSRIRKRTIKRIS